MSKRWSTPDYSGALADDPRKSRSVFVGSSAIKTLPDQDHRNVKSRTDVVLGFKRFRNAAITLAGIELMHRIRKGQFNLVKLSIKDTVAPAV
jgi:transposase-like protein